MCSRALWNFGTQALLQLPLLLLRLVLPEALIASAALSDAIACVGVGRIFQIWEPEAARRRTEEARLRARERGLTLPAAGGKP
jgi:hypothetical protein